MNTNDPLSEKMPLRPEELDLLDDLAALTKTFSQLPTHRSGENEEWVVSVHRLQDLIMSRAAARLYPDRFTPLKLRHE